MAEQSSLRTYDPLYPEPVENKYLLRKMFEFRDAFEPVFARQTKKVKHQAAVALIELSRMSYTVSPSNLPWYRTRNRKGVNAGTFLVLGNWLGKSKVDDKRLHYTPSDELLKDIPANPLITHEPDHRLKKRLMTAAKGPDAALTSQTTLVSKEPSTSASPINKGKCKRPNAMKPSGVLPGQRPAKRPASVELPVKSKRQKGATKNATEHEEATKCLEKKSIHGKVKAQGGSGSALYEIRQKLKQARKNAREVKVLQSALAQARNERDLALSELKISRAARIEAGSAPNDEVGRAQIAGAKWGLDLFQDSISMEHMIADIMEKSGRSYMERQMGEILEPIWRRMMPNEDIANAVDVALIERLER